MEELLALILKQAASAIGQAVINKVKDALFGKPTSLDDIQSLLDGLEKTVAGLPSELVHRLQEQEYQKAISTANHNIDNHNFEDLLEFLDDGKEKSYWGMANSLALEITGASAQDMETQRDNPEHINFNRDAYMFQANLDALKKVILVTDYVTLVTNHVVALSTAVVALQHTATLALKKIKEVPAEHPLYKDCQARLNNDTTKKYLPYDQDEAHAGLTSILAPALKLAPRVAVGLDFAAFYEKTALQGAKKGSPWLAMSNYGLKDNPRRYFQWGGNLETDKSPYTSDDGTKNWYFQFSDETLQKLRIINYNHGKDDICLMLGEIKGGDGAADFGVWVLDAEHTNKESDWDLYWSVTSIDLKLVHLFKSVELSNDKTSYMLSVNDNVLRNYVDIRTVEDKYSMWVLEV